MIKKIKNIVLKSDFLTLFALRIYRHYLNNKAGITIGKNTIVAFSSELGGNNIIGEKSKFLASKIGACSYISENSEFKNTQIGKFSSIGPNVKCIFGNHPTKQFVSTHPAFFSLRKQAGFTFVRTQLFDDFSIPKNNYSIHIGNDVWIGANVAILDGITIGDGAIVAANALVNKDVPPYSIVGGVPAKHIKYRFSDAQIDFLLSFKWWDQDMSWLEQHASDFQNIENFISKNSHG